MVKGDYQKFKRIESVEEEFKDFVFSENKEFPCTL